MNLFKPETPKEVVTSIAHTRGRIRDGTATLADRARGRASAIKIVYNLMTAQPGAERKLAGAHFNRYIDKNVPNPSMAEMLKQNGQNLIGLFFDQYSNMR